MLNIPQPIISKPGTPDFAALIRSWVHYDNLATSHSKQAHNSRKLRESYETAIITSLKNVNAANAIIQIAGGKIQITEEKATQHISLSLITQLLHDYFKQYNKQDDTDNIINYITSHRKTTTVQKLKKTEN